MLKQSGTLLAQYPFRLLGGGALAGARQLWGRTERVNFSIGEGVTDDLAAIPNGHLHPSAWVLPRKPGGMSAYTGTVITTSTAPLVVSAGRNIDGSTSVQVSVPAAQLQLVVSASGSATVTFTLQGNLAGSLNASGSTTVTFAPGTVTLGALAGLFGSIGVTASGSATPRAIGHMAGDITPFTPLSPEGLANAVWRRVVEAGFTAEEILRIVAAHAAGAATGLEGSNPQFRGLDGTTVRIDGTYSAGTRTIDALDGS